MKVDRDAARRICAAFGYKTVMVWKDYRLGKLLSRLHQVFKEEDPVWSRLRPEDQQLMKDILESLKKDSPAIEIV